MFPNLLLERLPHYRRHRRFAFGSDPPQLLHELRWQHDGCAIYVIIIVWIA